MMVMMIEDLAGEVSYICKPQNNITFLLIKKIIIEYYDFYVRKIIKRRMARFVCLSLRYTFWYIKLSIFEHKFQFLEVLKRGKIYIVIYLLISLEFS
jgi:hypothetical protein